MAEAATGVIGTPPPTIATSPGCPPAIELWVWRHPRPIGAVGRCIGRADLPLDLRRARRLAHRIATIVRDANLPREVWTSPLIRCAQVGRLLAQRGFAHRVDARLAELDFGTWDGRPWNAIAAAEVAQWEADFEHHRPGGGESVASLMRRAAAFLAERAATMDVVRSIDAPPAVRPTTTHPASSTVLVVGHAGWINAVRLLGQPPQVAHWPAPVGYGALLRLRKG